jgi:hypothetical protein
MKLIRNITLSLLFLGFSGNTLAGDLALQASKHKTSMREQSARVASNYQTDVHVLNNSSQIISIKVPGTPINDSIYPMEVEDIYSSRYYDAIEIMLYDEDGFLFFDSYVPNHASVEVRDMMRGRSTEPSKKQGKVQALIKKE